MRRWCSGLLACAWLLACPAVFAGTVHGKVTKHGNPVATTLWFTDQEGHKESVSSDANGDYGVPLPPGEYSIATIEGAVTPKIIVVFHEPQELDVVVSEAK